MNLSRSATACPRDEAWDRRRVVEPCRRIVGEDNSYDELRKGHEDEVVPLGFTFSYPTLQDSIDHGVLQTWTKGFDIKGVEGHDIAEQLRDALEKRKLPINLVALANDTTGALIASTYTDPKTVIGAIFGTGCNATYMETWGSIPKLRD